MDFEQVIKSRCSVRKFESAHLEQEAVDKILNAGHLAPTGCNYQPQRILVLNTDESIEKLRGCTKCHFGAPCAFLVCYNRDETWRRPHDGAMSAPVDAVIVATHMVLEAQNIGVGSCIVMHFDPYKMRETFRIPENIEPSLLLVMGYPHKDAAPLELHSKFRSPGDVVFYDSL